MVNGWYRWLTNFIDGIDGWYRWLTMVALMIIPRWLRMDGIDG